MGNAINQTNLPSNKYPSLLQRFCYDYNHLILYRAIWFSFFCFIKNQSNLLNFPFSNKNLGWKKFRILFLFYQFLNRWETREVPWLLKNLKVFRKIRNIQRNFWNSRNFVCKSKKFDNSANISNFRTVRVELKISQRRESTNHVWVFFGVVKANIISKLINYIQRFAQNPIKKFYHIVKLL